MQLTQLSYRVLGKDSLLVHITIDCKPLPFAGSIPSLHPQRPLDPNQPPLYNAHPLPGAILTSSVFVLLVFSFLFVFVFHLYLYLHSMLTFYRVPFYHPASR